MESFIMVEIRQPMEEEVRGVLFLPLLCNGEIFRELMIAEENKQKM
jgi:hypothetical protein